METIASIYALIQFGIIDLGILRQVLGMLVEVPHPLEIPILRATYDRIHSSILSIEQIDYDKVAHYHSAGLDHIWAVDRLTTTRRIRENLMESFRVGSDLC